MITWEEARENPELMIKHKDNLKNERIFEAPWYAIFWRHPYLFREFSDRFDEMGGRDISRALTNDPTLVLDIKDYLHKMGESDVACALVYTPALVLELRDYLHKMDRWTIGRLLGSHPELSLCIKYKDDPDKLEAAYYITFPHKLDNLNKEEKREMSKRIMELLREEKV
jgi:hypothetical protein